MFNKEENSLEKVKITYSGAEGKIGQHALAILCATLKPHYLIEMTLIGSGTPESLKRLEGLKKDLNGILYSNYSEENMIFTITNDYQKITGSNLLIYSDPENPAESQDENEIHNSDQKEKSIQFFAEKANIFCPGSLMIISTSQVDHMCYIARKVAPKVHVLGLSGAVDSPRLRNILFKKHGIYFEGFFIGFHNFMMFPVLKNIKAKDGKLFFPALCKENDSLSEDKIKLIKEQAKLFEIMKEMKIMCKQSEGLREAQIISANVVVKTIQAYCFDEEFKESWNVCVKGKAISEYYGIEEGVEVSIPVTIKKNQISISTEIPIMQKEKKILNDLVREVKERMKN